MSQSTPWPEIIMRSFFVAGSSSTTFEKRYYGPWNRLLNTMFPVDTAFEVVPQFPATTVHEAVDFILLLLVYVDSTPVFVVQIKPLDDSRHNSKRQEADLQLRRRFLDLSTDLKLPVLHGISVFGTKLAFYSYDKNSRRIQPKAVTPDPDVLVDAAPREWWSYDILEEAGANKFRGIVEEVKEMCEAISLN